LLTDGYYSFKMDVWGYGCVFFEVLSLFPLFPGNNELDQIHKIHNVLGTPPKELLEKFKKQASHIEFNFPPKEGTGISKLIPHVSPECLDLLEKLLAYNPEERLTSKEAIKHPYFKDLYENDKKMMQATNMGPNNHLLRGTFQFTNSQRSLKLDSEINSDGQSVTDNMNNLSQYSTNPNYNNINININTNSSIGNNSNININLSKKRNKNDKTKLPDINRGVGKVGLNHGSEESDNDQNLPPISNSQKPYYIYKKPKPGLHIGENPPGYIPISKKYKMNDVKKNYVSPYSQKAIIASKHPM